MFGRKLRALQGADTAGAIEGVHLVAQIAQADARVSLRPSANEFRDHILKRQIVVIPPLEGHERAEQRPGLTGLNPRGEQEQERVQIVLLRHDAVFAQILSDDRCRNAEAVIGPRGPIKARREKRKLVGIREGIILADMGKAVPARPRCHLPEAAIG